MTIKRITISVSAKVAARIKKAAGRAPVSTWVTDVVQQHLEEAKLASAWEEFLRDVAPSRKDSLQADVIWKRLSKPAAKKPHAA